MSKEGRTQIYFAVIALFNVLYNWLPFFSVKKALLSFAGIQIGERSYIHRPVKLFALKRLSVGDYTTINDHCYLDNRKGITIGSNVNIAHNTRIYTLGHDINSSSLPDNGAPVTIDDDVFVFANVLIMPGVHIGKGAVVFPGSVVVKDVDPYTMVGGNPAKYVKDRNKIEYDKKEYGYWFAQ